MLSQGQVGIRLQLRREPLPQGLAFHRWSAGDLVYFDVPRKAPPFEPALDGREGDSEGLCDPLFWDAAIYSGERLQPEVLRVGVHGLYFRVGPLLRQAAVRASL